MPRISRYNYDLRRLEWVDATPEEHAAWKAKRAAKAKMTRAEHSASAGTSTTETLEPGDGATESPPVEATGPKRKGGPNTRPASILAPALPRMAQALSGIVRSVTGQVSRGRAPMTIQEAAYIAVPTVRIADRTVAKWVRKSAKVTENQEDAAIIAVTLLMWLLGWVISSLTNAPRQPVTAMPQMTADVFAGSEPSGPAPAPMRAAPTVPQSDDGDLFAGSEPLATSADTATAPVPRQQADPRQAAQSEQLWAVISPTDYGEALAG